MNTRNKLLLTLLTTSICASVHAEVERRDLSGFTGVDASSGINVDIRIGEQFLVEVDADENIDDIETEVRNGTLHVRVESDAWDWGDWQDDHHVTIVMPVLTELEASGGSDIRVLGTVTGPEFEINASGGVDIEVDVAVDRLEIEVSGGADVEVSGTANIAIVRTSGGSDVDARELTAVHADLRASGGSDLSISVSGTIDVRASGGADIDYYGDPEVLDEDESGSADITRH